MTLGVDSVVLFLDFHKAFDSVNHLFMATLLGHMGFPPLFVAWVMTLYSGALSYMQYKNWLTETFHLGRGFRQG